ncbi:MAG: EAL domain-containing protein [Paucibacter sp.]|nr:EAL domain-containing protein [Roseateles sp.]
MARADTMSYEPGIWRAAIRRLRRFDGSEPSTSGSFKARRERLLSVGSVVLLSLSSFWALAFLWLGLPSRSIYNLPGVALALLIMSSLRARWHRIASLLFVLAGTLAVALTTLFVDVPTLLVPRSIPLYLMPLSTLTLFLMRHERWPLRVPMVCLQLVLFCGLAVNSGTYHQINLLSDGQRLAAAVGTALCAFLLQWWVVQVIMSEVRARSAMEFEFARAVAEGHLGFHLQAQCDVQGRVIGAEALMRWTHPQQGPIAPTEFIAMAERSGLIVPAGERILREVCALLARWRNDPDLATLSIAVNLSAAQLFQDGLPVRLLERVPEMRGMGGRLKLELTESIFVQDVAVVRSLLEDFRHEGIRIALDDFGTGFSSLTYLRRLPLDQLKVDKSFVCDVLEDSHAAKIAQTIVQLGRDLHLEVVAEGVETDAQRDMLQDMGCHAFQGYLFARPMPVEAFEAHARAQACAAGRAA